MPVLTFLSERSPPLIFLVGTKSDLTPHYSDQDMLDYREALDILLKSTGYQYFETSSFKGTGHKELMHKLIDEKESWPTHKAGDSGKQNGNKKKKSGGCFSCCG